MSRRDRARTILRLAAPIVFGIAAGGFALPALLAQHWILALWAGLTAVWTFPYAAHSCPTPPPAEPPAPIERGHQAVTFTGGPVDGGTYAIPFAGRDLADAVIHLEGTDYRVTTIDHTCYTAEAIR